MFYWLGLSYKIFLINFVLVEDLVSFKDFVVINFFLVIKCISVIRLNDKFF